MRRYLRQRLADWLGVTRLNQAVSYLLMHDLGVLSVAPHGPEGHTALQNAFLNLVTVLRPNVFCDIGSYDGSISLAVHSVAPGCEIHAFEANPETYARYNATLAAKGIVYRNLAISDRSGRTTVHAPQGRHAGKTSLLLRNEETAYDSFDVEMRSLDELFAKRLGRDKASFFLWIDVEGAADRVLAGAPGVLSQTLAIFIECETAPFWHDGGSIGRIASLLLGAGFIPVARDREYGDKQFNVLFVSSTIADLLVPYLFDASSPLRACLTPCPVSNSTQLKLPSSSGRSEPNRNEPAT